MGKDDIFLDDFYRILHGEIPLEFYIELVIRSLFVFFLLTFGMKYFGKRQSSQLTRSELAATSTLAAATGLIILAPDRGMLPPIVIILVVITIQRFVHKRAMESKKFEFATEGHFSLLVSEGEMLLDAMDNARISREQLFSQLRSSNVLHLGQVKRFYLEASGDFTLIKREQELPGLSVIPDWDKDFLDEQSRSEKEVCAFCGHLAERHDRKCERCGHEEWQKAAE